MTDDQAQMIDKFHKGQTEGLHAVMRDNMSLQKEIADLRIQLALRSNEATMTDLETLTEVFEKMGMKPNKEADPDGSGTVSLCISHAYFSFTERGAFLGIDTYENAHKRMVASGLKS